MYEQSPSAPTERRKVGYLVVFAENGAAFLLGPYYCLPKGTKVIMEDGNSKKSIENIQVGDYILSYNEITGQKERDKVMEISNMLSDEIMTLNFSNGNRLVCTPNHPLYIHGKGWVKAEDLTVGDQAIQLKYVDLHYRLIRIDRPGFSRRHWATGLNRSTDERINRVASMKEGNKRPDITERNLENNPMLKEKTRKKVSTSVKYKFDNDPEYVYNYKKGRKKFHKAIQQHPNLSERKLIKVLEEACPGEWKYNGGGELGLSMDNMNPDFVNVNGKKKVIELFGEYWHQPEGENLRKERFRKIGWECLVIWNKEMKDIDNVKKKILDFIYNPNTEVITVTEIKRVSKMARVYDISTENNHNFFAYGILVHNTQKHLKLRYEAQKGRKAIFMTYEQDPEKAKDEFQVAMANQQHE